MAGAVTRVSRRTFVFTGAATLLSARVVHGLPPRGGSQNRPMRPSAGGRRPDSSASRRPWREKTVDTFKAGNPDTLVTGVATTVMATLGPPPGRGGGRNLVITHEPTFYTGNDKPARGRAIRLPREKSLHRRAPARRLALRGSLGRAKAERIRRARSPTRSAGPQTAAPDNAADLRHSADDRSGR